MRRRVCVEVDDGQSMRATRTALPVDERGSETRLRRCLVGFGDEVRAGVLVPSPAGMICSMPVVIDDEAAHDR